MQSQGDIPRLTAGPPGIPQDRLDALRAAYRKAMEDPELQAKAAKLGASDRAGLWRRRAGDDQGRAQSDAGNDRATERGTEAGAAVRDELAKHPLVVSHESESADGATLVRLGD